MKAVITYARINMSDGGLNTRAPPILMFTRGFLGFDHRSHGITSTFESKVCLGTSGPLTVLNLVLATRMASMATCRKEQVPWFYFAPLYLFAVEQFSSDF